MSRLRTCLAVTGFAALVASLLLCLWALFQMVAPRLTDFASTFTHAPAVFGALAFAALFLFVLKQLTD